MSRRYSSSRSYSTQRRSAKPLVGFIIIASFGILFAGCGGPEDVEDETLVFTQDDVARYRELAGEPTSGSGASSSAADIAPLPSGSGTTKAAGSIELDLSQIDAYASMRMGVSGGASNVYQVTNQFLNVRDTPSTGGKQLANLSFGDSVEVIEYLNGTWAKVKAGGVEGYVSHRYLSKVTSDERLADEKKRFENMYYVSFGFVNMRKEPSQSSEKLGEIPGQTILTPISIANDWAKVSFEGKEGYVSVSYLSPFLPNFVVRQDMYELPVLQYRITKDRGEELIEAMGKQANEIRAAGYSFMTMRDLYDLLQRQQKGDVRLDPTKVIIAVSGITPGNIRAVSDALTANNIKATLFIESQHLGPSGITEKTLLTMMANGFDIQSGTHTGDDMRALTNAQVELEVRQSRKMLEEYTRKPVFAISYPQGGVNDRVAQIAADAGYLFGVGDDADRSFGRSQFLRIPAMTVFPSMDTAEVVRFVTGS